MRIQYASDLHIEFGSRPLRKSDIKGDVLVLSGDIAGNPEQLAQSLRLLSGDVPILYVMGNHEFFGHDFALDPGHYRKAIEGFPHVYLLEDRRSSSGASDFWVAPSGPISLEGCRAPPPSGE
jgi:Calcineurin-like phosphoesterase.